MSAGQADKHIVNFAVGIGFRFRHRLLQSLGRVLDIGDEALAHPLRRRAPHSQNGEPLGHSFRNDNGCLTRPNINTHQEGILVLHILHTASLSVRVHSTSQRGNVSSGRQELLNTFPLFPLIQSQ